MDDIDLGHVQTDPLFNLKKKLKNDEDDDDPYSQIGHSCNYLEPDEFKWKYSNLKNSFSYFSYNIRSLGGSWNDFQDLLANLHSTNKFRFTVIGLQEVWNVPPNFNYELNGYKKFEYKIRNSMSMKSLMTCLSLSHEYLNLYLLKLK